MKNILICSFFGLFLSATIISRPAANSNLLAILELTSETITEKHISPPGLALARIMAVTREAALTSKIAETRVTMQALFCAAAHDYRTYYRHGFTVTRRYAYDWATELRKNNPDRFEEIALQMSTVISPENILGLNQ